MKKHLAAKPLSAEKLPLALAISCRHWELVKYLLRKKPVVKQTNLKDTPILNLAVEHYAPEEVLKTILRLGADINATDDQFVSALSLAAALPDESAVRFLLANGANPKPASVDETNPVSQALCRDNQDLARLLIDQGGTATLHEAARCGHLPMVQKLVRAGADLEAVDSWEEQTPLLVAISNEYPDVVEFLLDSKADPNVQQHYRAGANTALHLAVLKASARMVKLLLAAGADPDADNDEHLTPLELAKRRGSSHLVHLMEAHIDRNRRDRAVEQLYTIHRVAELLSVDTPFVLQLIKTGKLRELKLDPETSRIPESSVGRYLSGLEQ